MSDDRKINPRAKNSATAVRLKTLLDREGLTSEDFAVEMEFGIDLVNKMRTGSAPLTLENAIKIRKKYGVSLDWLYGLDEDMGDDAGKMLLYLDEFIKFKRGDKGDVYDLIFEIDTNVLDFLIKVTEARETKEKSAMPDYALEAWIDGEKKVFNEKYKSSTNRNKVWYPLIEDCLGRMPDQVKEVYLEINEGNKNDDL